MSHLDSTTAPLLERLNLIQESSQNLLSELRHYADGLSFDSQTANDINRQCDVYDDIKRKYGPTLDDAQKFYNAAKEKYDLIKNFEHNDRELHETLKTQEKELSKIAQKITKKRQTAASDLKEIIEKELKELGINHVQFETRCEKIPFTINGQDQIIFYISPNAGEDLKPLAEIVSSGEAARVMLALKKALIKADSIPVLIFDEIDAQIGGRLGTVTGKKLKELSHHRQVILITHLPQIASFGDVHFKVIKSVKSGRTITEVNELDHGARVEEIAQMMSGQEQSKFSVKHAQEMLANAQQ